MAQTTDELSPPSPVSPASPVSPTSEPQASSPDLGHFPPPAPTGGARGTVGSTPPKPIELIMGDDPLLGPDPHPILGWRSNRLPGIARNFDIGPAARAVPKIVPWTEALAVTFATRESEARDRFLATEELMRVADWILGSAHEVLLRQGHLSTLEKPQEGDPNPTIRLTFGETGAIFVRASSEFEVVSIVQIHAEPEPRVQGEQDPGKFCRIHITPPKKEHLRFRFARLRWYLAKQRRSRERREDEPAPSGREHPAPGREGAYEFYGDPVDPSQQIVSFIHGMVHV
jgi:hypothetical protein